MFNNKQELEEYRRSIEAEVPEVCEIVEVYDRQFKVERLRVTAYFCPHIRKEVPVELRYFANVDRGSGRMVSVWRPYYTTRVRSTVVPVRRRDRRVEVVDSSAWAREHLWKRHTEIIAECRARGEVLLRFCTREEATHIEGAGGCSGIFRVDRVRRTGETVKWPPERIEEERARALWYIREEQYLMDAVRTKA